MTLRAHQHAFDRTITGIINGSGVRDIVAHVCPGGGKSTLPIQAGRLLTAGLADRIAWICPRASLQDQGERNFIDPRFRRMFNHDLFIRSSTNQENPSRGLAGWVSTYQALAVDDRKTALRDFERLRYILVLDEFHHLAADGEWTEPIRELYDRAAFRVLMTGTMARGDLRKIAFAPYREVPPYGGDVENQWAPCFDDCDNTSLITYTRRDALADRAIIPLEFHFAEGVAEWQKESGRVVRSKLSADRSDANQALYTALRTEYAIDLLTVGCEHWSRGGGSLLVVAASIESAKEYTAILKRQGLHAEIATSDDSPAAQKAIKALKGGKLKILVTVGMCYEGLDVPSISHLICLTNIRSMPWIEQMVARAVRIDPLAGPYETQKGYIFAPADRMFVELARRIEADQQEAVAKQKPASDDRTGGNGNGNGGGPKITPLSSKLILGQADLFGYEPETYGVPPRYDYEKTQREIETELRSWIETHVREYCRVYSCHPGLLNRMVRDIGGKARENMTVAELERVKGWLLQTHPIPQRSEAMTVLEPVRAGRF